MVEPEVPKEYILWDPAIQEDHNKPFDAPNEDVVVYRLRSPADHSKPALLLAPADWKRVQSLKNLVSKAITLIVIFLIIFQLV